MSLIRYAPISPSVSLVGTSSRSDGSMRQSSEKMRQLGVKLPQDAGERVTRFLRGRYPHNTAKYVSADTGISVKTVAKWLERSSVPSFEHIGSLLYAYEAEFLTAAFPGLSWVAGLINLTRREALAEQLAAADQELAETYRVLRGGR